MQKHIIEITGCGIALIQQFEEVGLTPVILFIIDISVPVIIGKKLIQGISNLSFIHLFDARPVNNGPISLFQLTILTKNIGGEKDDAENHPKNMYSADLHIESLLTFFNV